MENRSIQFNQTGSADVLHLVQAPLPQPAAGQVRVCNAAIGVNFIDTYHRSGLYPVALPSGIGLEAAGWIDAVGDGVSGWQKGDRVAYCSGPLGAYSDFHCVAAERLLPIPAGLAFETVAATLLKGLTAAYLLHETVQPKPGSWVLIHAAAGGVGQILCRWAKALGLKVVGTVGANSKRAAAIACGCDAVLEYRSDAFVDDVKALTGGVDVVFDGVGKDTFYKSIEVLNRRGHLISFGNASGPVPAFAPLLLAQHGSLYITRPTLADYTATQGELYALWEKLCEALEKGWLVANIGGRFALADANKAHALLAKGATQGSLILEPASHAAEVVK